MYYLEYSVLVFAKYVNEFSGLEGLVVAMELWILRVLDAEYLKTHLEKQGNTEILETVLAPVCLSHWAEAFLSPNTIKISRWAGGRGSPCRSQQPYVAQYVGQTLTSSFLGKSAETQSGKIPPVSGPRNWNSINSKGIKEWSGFL